MSDFLWPIRHQRANKRHICHECWRTITVGETYARAAGINDGTAWSSILCAHCEVVAEYLMNVDGEVWYGGVAETIEAWAETPVELYYLHGIRQKWTRTDGTLMHVPVRATYRSGRAATASLHDGRIGSWHQLSL